jgi:hypothetical protein
LEPRNSIEGSGPQNEGQQLGLNLNGIDFQMDWDGKKGFISRYLGDVFAIRSTSLNAT